MFERLRKTFYDADGSFAIPEISAAGTAGLVIARAIRDFASANPFPYSEIGTCIGAIVVALGVAQRIRDGLFKGDDK
jgi:hypothetical protein